jgi:hypothetical protein
MFIQLHRDPPPPSLPSVVEPLIRGMLRCVTVGRLFTIHICCLLAWTRVVQHFILLSGPLLPRDNVPSSSSLHIIPERPRTRTRQSLHCCKLSGPYRTVREPYTYIPLNETARKKSGACELKNAINRLSCNVWSTPRIELGTSCTRSRNHASRPSGRLL